MHIRPRCLHPLQAWLFLYFILKSILTCFFCRDSIFSTLSLLSKILCLASTIFELPAFWPAAFCCFLLASLLASASFLYLSFSTLFYLATFLSFFLFLFLFLACFCTSVNAWTANSNSSSKLGVVRDENYTSYIIFFLENRRKSWKK